jgi:hypothetical protein
MLAGTEPLPLAMALNAATHGIVERCISPISGVDPVTQPFTTSNRTTGCGSFTSRNTAAWTSTPMSTMRGSSFVPWRGSPSFGIHALQSEVVGPAEVPFDSTAVHRVHLWRRATNVLFSVAASGALQAFEIVHSLFRSWHSILALEAWLQRGPHNGFNTMRQSPRGQPGDQLRFLSLRLLGADQFRPVLRGDTLPGTKCISCSVRSVGIHLGPEQTNVIGLLRQDECQSTVI